MAEDDLYDIAADPEESADHSAAPVVPLAYRTPSAVAKKYQELSDDPIIDFYLPLTLLGGGVVVESIAALIRYHGSSTLLRGAMVDLGLGLGLGTAVMLAALWTAAKFRGIEFGPFWTAVLKLAAVSVGPGAVITLLSPALHFIPFGFLLGFVFQFILYFALLGALFKMDESDTWYCVCVIFLLNVGLYFVMQAVR
jgi:hypothetical protein